MYAVPSHHRAGPELVPETIGSTPGAVVPLHRGPDEVALLPTQGTLALELEPRCEVPTTPTDLRLRRQVDAWVQRFAQAAAEIVGGDRPPSQLVRWTSKEVFWDLERRAVLVARAGGHRPGQGRVQPVRPRVLSVHSFFHDAAVVEASVHLRYGERSRALAARFEMRAGRWLCTALEWA